MELLANKVGRIMLTGVITDASMECRDCVGAQRMRRRAPSWSDPLSRGSATGHAVVDTYDQEGAEHRCDEQRWGAIAIPHDSTQKGASERAHDAKARSDSRVFRLSPRRHATRDRSGEQSDSQKQNDVHRNLLPRTR
jgi:hypothetical protein